MYSVSFYPSNTVATFAITNITTTIYGYIYIKDSQYYAFFETPIVYQINFIIGQAFNTSVGVTTTPSDVSPTVYVIQYNIQYNVNYNDSPTFSQGALSAGNNAATITRFFFRGLDPTKTTITDEELREIGKSARKAISHSVSTTEWVVNALQKTIKAITN